MKGFSQCDFDGVVKNSLNVERNIYTKSACWRNNLDPSPLDV